jgi:hypothetical protein
MECSVGVMIVSARRQLPAAAPGSERPGDFDGGRRHLVARYSGTPPYDSLWRVLGHPGSPTQFGPV